MTFVSYAQNFEDVMLHRAFKDLGAGFYIDVGAGHPDSDSVTRAFYDNGWRGINIEPFSEFYGRLKAARHRDINLNVAVGETADRLSFFQISDTGLSTLEPQIAAEHRAAGLPVEKITVEQTTLAEICRLYAPSEIHFLKIDVEGAERHVLAGADFTSFRPWIVVVEATKPRTQIENYHDWEPILLSANYEFVWFDGLNRFYLAAEKYAALRQHFVLPPNFFDNFLRASDNLAVHYITVARLQVAEAERHRSEAAAHAAEQERRRIKAETGLAEMAEIKRLKVEADARAEQADTARQITEARLEAVLRSKSWRVTAPLRFLNRVTFGRLRSARQFPPSPSASLSIEQEAVPREALRLYEMLRRSLRPGNNC